MICHVTSREHMFKGLCEIMGGIESLHLLVFGGHWFSANGDIKYLICHMTFENHVTERSYTFLSGCSSLPATILPTLVAIGIVVVEIHCF